MSIFRYPQTQTSITGVATEAKQDTIITELQDINTELDGQTTSLGSIVTNTANSATESTLSTLNGKVTAVNTNSVTITSSTLPTGAATEAKQDSIISQLQSSLSPVDFLDSGVVNASSTNITTSGLTVVSTLAANVSELEVIEDIGEFMALTDGADVVLSYLPLGGGRVKVSIPSTTTLKIASLTGSSITLGSIAINFLD